MQDAQKKQLQEILHTEIIATKVLEFEILDLNDEFLSLKAPIKTNINDKKTAFGGSVSALCMISGWSLCWLVAKEIGVDADIVIYKSEIDFKLPLKKDFTTKVFFPPKEKIEKLKQNLQKRKKSSLELEITIKEDEKTAVNFYGKYVFIVN